LEQCPLRATRWQLYADAGNVLDHARANLDQALSNNLQLLFSIPFQWARRCARVCMYRPHRSGEGMMRWALAILGAAGDGAIGIPGVLAPGVTPELPMDASTFAK
jgi:hypothetical protein